MEKHTVQTTSRSCCGFEDFFVVCALLIGLLSVAGGGYYAIQGPADTVPYYIFIVVAGFLCILLVIPCWRRMTSHGLLLGYAACLFGVVLAQLIDAAWYTVRPVLIPPSTNVRDTLDPSEIIKSVTLTVDPNMETLVDSGTHAALQRLTSPLVIRLICVGIGLLVCSLLGKIHANQKDKAAHRLYNNPTGCCSISHYCVSFMAFLYLFMGTAYVAFPLINNHAPQLGLDFYWPAGSLSPSFRGVSLKPPVVTVALLVTWIVIARKPMSTTMKWRKYFRLIALALAILGQVASAIIIGAFPEQIGVWETPFSWAAIALGVSASLLFLIFLLHLHSEPRYIQPDPHSLFLSSSPPLSHDLGRNTQLGSMQSNASHATLQSQESAQQPLTCFYSQGSAERYAPAPTQSRHITKTYYPYPKSPGNHFTAVRVVPTSSAHQIGYPTHATP